MRKIKIQSQIGYISEDFDTPIIRNILANLEEHLHSQSAHILQQGRHITTKLTTPTCTIVVKSFGRQSPIKDLFDSIFGSKAVRTYRAASFMVEHNVGTAKPIACLEEWHHHRLIKSYFISQYLDGSIQLKDILAQNWRQGSDLTPLLHTIAQELRKLHDSGATHGDLGNQNIELKENKIILFDLNRAHFYNHPVSNKNRAKDLARIHLPKGLFQRFFTLYFGGTIPTTFRLFYAIERLKYRIHNATRTIRHPFRELKYKRHPQTAPAQTAYPILISPKKATPDALYTDLSGHHISYDMARTSKTKIYQFYPMPPNKS